MTLPKGRVAVAMRPNVLLAERPAIKIAAALYALDNMAAGSLHQIAG